MTELFIGGISVVLPQNMSTTVRRENSYFTKNGEYTYDITLDLNNKVNIELYKHLSRLNSVSEITERRPAVLIADNRVYCNGTEIITEWTDKTVSIQIASGNSELNYFIGSDLLISSLDMMDWDFIPRRQFITDLYPDIAFCLAPVYNRTAETTINEWWFNKTSSTGEYQSILKPNWKDGDYIAQPFLCSFIKVLLEALGYKLIQNDIENSQWKDLYICHLNNTTKWQNMVPGWKVSDFLEQIEKLFNTSFVIDSRKKEVKLLFNNSFFANSTRVHVTQIVDEFEAEMDNESSEEIQHSNIRYAFPDNEYFRTQCIPDHLYKNAKKGEIPLSWSEPYPEGTIGFNYLYLWFSREENQVKDTIFLDQRTGYEYIYQGKDSFLGPYYAMVNVFGPINRDEAANTIELDIMPVEMGFWEWWTYTDGVKSGTYMSWVIPTIDHDGEVSEEEEDLDLLEQIKNGTSETSESKGPIYLAFHQGLNNPTISWQPKNAFPTPFTNEYLMLFLSVPIRISDSSLRLRQFEIELYSNGYEIDTSKSITFTSYDPNLFDVRSIFECRNKLYACREIEYTLTTQGRSGAWKGVFHPLKISDTEAYQKWILEDGKWRDAGVWMENGRWLDE